MVFFHIDKLNVSETNKNPSIILDNIIQKDKKNKVFVLIHMEGCGPCMATLPEWKKIENVLKKFANRNDIAIVDIERQALDHVKNIKIIQKIMKLTVLAINLKLKNLMV